MKRFLFITHLTPKNKRSSLRSDLMKIMENALHAQQYDNWRALWIGEEEKTEGKIQVVALNGNDLEEHERNIQKIYDRPDVQQLLNEADLIVKLDDDDVISRLALAKASTLEFDCYCDRSHTFYDMSSGTITQQKRDWIASTAIHKKEHALTDPVTGERSANLYRSLFYTDHSAEWMKYYRSRKIVFTETKEPLYLRVLSPTSITAGGSKKQVSHFRDIDMGSYYEYLRSFGAWNTAKVTGFEEYLAPLREAWENFSGSSQQPVQGIAYIDKFKDHLRNYIK